MVDEIMKEKTFTKDYHGTAVVGTTYTITITRGEDTYIGFQAHGKPYKLRVSYRDLKRLLEDQ